MVDSSLSAVDVPFFVCTPFTGSPFFANASHRDMPLKIDNKSFTNIDSALRGGLPAFQFDCQSCHSIFQRGDQVGIEPISSLESNQFFSMEFAFHLVWRSESWQEPRTILDDRYQFNKSVSGSLLS
jgi:hypothetical protein